MTDSDCHHGAVPRQDGAGADQHSRFLMLFLRNEREVFRYICALVPNLTDAQDLLQQTALALWRKFDQYDSGQPFAPWACRFALLEVKAFLRRQAGWQALLEGDLAQVLLERRQSMMAEMEARFAHLNDCLGKLPPVQGALVSQYYFDRKTVDDLARSTGRSVEAIYKALQRIRKLLLDCVTAAMGPSEAGA